MAAALVGRAVTIQSASGTIEGVVARVVTKSGEPKLVVRGAEYSLSQILTAAPNDLAQPAQTQPTEKV